ncbi:hypothetical protein HQ585_07200 [candidate division KSB1 bacterium]|nr:hypothetical protein [candidate division KSB1 bacterium]
MKSKLYIGIDIGAVSAKVALLPQMNSHTVLESVRELTDSPVRFNSFQIGSDFIYLSEYFRHMGEPERYIRNLFTYIKDIFSKDYSIATLFTGSGGKQISKRYNQDSVNSISALAEGVGWMYPKVHTIFEMGGESSKYVQIHRDDDQNIQIVDYETNGECAAGTGSFFDQQVERLRLSIEEVGGLIANTKNAASIAGRCSVFAKSDMIHAQQRGYSPEEILKGLCEAVVRNFKGSITKGKHIEPSVAFVGGVAKNRGIVNAIHDIFGFNQGDLIVPDHSAWMSAIGAARLSQKRESKECNFEINTSNSHQHPTTSALSLENVTLLRNTIKTVELSNHQKTDAYLGVDIGSVSTNLALIDVKGNLIHGIYVMTDGRPIEVVTNALNEMDRAVGNRVNVLGVGTTGSGRELIGLLVGADVVKDEITCHKTGAVFVSARYLDKKVDTIFEIGGQDSKFISIQKGAVVDFSLNEACAAGTGSFLEEQANKLGISIRDEFSNLALAAKNPLRLGERCTVFMEKELGPYLHQGVPKSDIAAGLALSVVHNYLNRVVKKRPIGNTIFFQGGTAYNDSVAAAFASILDKEIIVPPHNGIIGAIGAALLASENRDPKSKSNFRGWKIEKTQWKMREFECNGCTNHCAIQEFEIDGEKSHWGDKCSDRYRKRAKTLKKAEIPDLIDEQVSSIFRSENYDHPSRGRLGIPMCLSMYDRLPFWQTYFSHLGFEVVQSGPTKQKLVHQGLEATVAEPCFPVQVAHGHVAAFLDEKIDYIFMPNVVNEEDPTESVASFICPWTQTAPLVIKQSPMIESLKHKILSPNIEFVKGNQYVGRQLKEQLKFLDIPGKVHENALNQAYQTYQKYRQQQFDSGLKVIRPVINQKLPSLVLIGRPYNLYDPGLNLNIPAKLRNLYGANVLPMDFLPYHEIDIQSIHDHMFWNFGRRIIQAARWTRDYPFLHLIYLSNFKCGPDSYIRHYIEMAADKPYLFLQLDSHSNDAGVMTRIEAFLESKGML